MSDTPTTCQRCGEEFARRPLLQAEARHLAMKIGESAAEVAVDEALASYHEEGHTPTCGVLRCCRWWGWLSIEMQDDDDGMWVDCPCVCHGEGDSDE